MTMADGDDVYVCPAHHVQIRTITRQDRWCCMSWCQLDVRPLTDAERAVWRLGGHAAVEVLLREVTDA